MMNAIEVLLKHEKEPAMCECWPAGRQNPAGGWEGILMPFTASFLQPCNKLYRKHRDDNTEHQAEGRYNPLTASARGPR